MNISLFNYTKHAANRMLTRIFSVASAACLTATVSTAGGQTVNPAGPSDVVLAAKGGVTLQGNPYTPSGSSDFQIFALQGIDSSSLSGKGGFAPQVNTDFEFAPSIGVSYDSGGGKLTDFGLGLYANAAKQIQSTGLKIQYNAPVIASSVTITLEDFDLKAGATFFDPKKVEPFIQILGLNNTVYATASPTSVFSALVAQAAGKGSADVWNLNFGDLLSSLHLTDAPITGFILSADMNNGEQPNSDPYLLVSVGNGVPVPEPGNCLLLLAGLALLLPCFRKLRPVAQGSR